MSDIGGPSRPEFIPTEASTRVTRGESATDHGSAENQTRAKNAPLKKNAPPAEKPQYHDPAVTISASLSKLDEGAKFTAEVKGHDIDKRPIITSKHGTYIMQTDGKNEKVLSELSAGDKAELRVVNLEKEIKAQLIIRRNKETAEKLDRPQFEAISVTLTLTGLGAEDGKAKISETNNISLSQIAAQYPSGAVFQAEAAARHTTNALNDTLPLPAAGSKYTLFEKTLLNKHVPSARTALQRQNLNPLLFQEISKGAAQAPIETGKNPRQGAVINPTLSPAAPISRAQINELLHQPAALTLVKNFKNPNVTLPSNIPQDLRNSILKTIGQSAGGQLEPLNIFNPALKNKISIISVAIPESGPESRPESGPKIGTANESSLITANAPVQNLQSEATLKQNKGPEKNINHISAIVIDPQASLIQKMAAEHLGQSPVKNPPRPENSHTIKQSNIFLATPTSVIKMKTTIALPVGTVVHFTVPATAESSAGEKQKNLPIPTTTKMGLAPLLPEVVNISDLLEGWSSLSHLISSLNLNNFGAMANMVAAKIPNTASPANMAAGIVFFMAAIGRSFGKNSKPAEIWLGKSLTTELKKNGHEALLTRLNGEMMRIGDLAGDGTLREWRPAMFPISNGSEIQAIPFFIKKQSGDQNEGTLEDQNAKDEKNTRFMIELNLSQMGNILIDGMLTPKRLEIIIKTNITLDENFRKKISQKYDHALDKYNFTGSLTLQDDWRGSVSLKKMILQAETAALRSSAKTSFSTLT
jgi:hypothetical protein